MSCHKTPRLWNVWAAAHLAFECWQSMGHPGYVSDPHTHGTLHILCPIVALLNFQVYMRLLKMNATNLIVTTVFWPVAIWPAMATTHCKHYSLSIPYNKRHCPSDGTITPHLLLHQCRYTCLQSTTCKDYNRLVSQMRALLAACREPAGKLWQRCKVLYVFEHKNAISFNPCSIYPHCGILTHQ